MAMKLTQRAPQWALALGALLALAACGGSGGGGAGTPPIEPPPVVEKPATRDEAARFLAQATFGPTDADIDRLMLIGYAPWIDEQLALAPSAARSHRAHWEAADAALKAANPNASPLPTAGQNEVFESFWKQALTAPDPLRQRTAFALSQIFVISMVDSTVGNEPRAVADWLDMLGSKGFGSYRELLETVSLHPLMGAYLTHLRNQKANTTTGRVPDENYSREVMQLFSIGLVELNADGSVKNGAGGAALETYSPADITGLARVFTGWSFACPDYPATNCFNSGTNAGRTDPDRWFKPMLGYPAFHSTEVKSFLGSAIAVQATADPAASLRAALDTLSAHNNVGPFIGKQLIQRLVTSNPSAGYVAAVSGVFANNGAGQRGDMKAVIKAVLMHPEARTLSDSSGKVREPVLRLSAYLRAFPHRSDTGSFRVGNTDNAGTSLGQSPLRAPSVFNFYRPGFVAPGTRGAAVPLLAPELQIASETTAAGYVNTMRDNINSGVGLNNGTVNGVALNRRDLQPDFSAELALATDPAALVERVASRLTYGSAGTALKAEIVAAVNSLAIPALNAAGSNQAAIDTAKRSRVNTALLLVVASPEFVVQK
jgi:uncharacterized protein (DUF1800 family)